jgi:hypothetical protein
MQPFEYHPVSTFVDKLKRIERRDPPGFSRIMKVVGRILLNPDDADGRMHGRHHSRFKKYVGRRDYRLIYEWCEICRKLEKKVEDRCDQCSDVPDHSVVFFDVYHKNEATHI